jgi:hypothetical protein
MTKLCAWRADNFCRPLTIAGEIGLCLRPDQMDRGPAYSLYGVQVPHGTKWTSLGVIPPESIGRDFHRYSRDWSPALLPEGTRSLSRSLP